MSVAGGRTADMRTPHSDLPEQDPQQWSPPAGHLPPPRLPWERDWRRRPLPDVVAVRRCPVPAWAPPFDIQAGPAQASLDRPGPGPVIRDPRSQDQASKDAPAPGQPRPTGRAEVAGPPSWPRAARPGAAGPGGAGPAAEPVQTASGRVDRAGRPGPHAGAGAAGPGGGGGGRPGRRGGRGPSGHRAGQIPAAGRVSRRVKPSGRVGGRASSRRCWPRRWPGRARLSRSGRGRPSRPASGSGS